MNSYAGCDVLLLIVAVLIMPALSARAGIQLARSVPQSLLPRYWSIILRGWAAVAMLLGLWWWAGRPLRTLGLDVPLTARGQWAFLLDALLIAFFTAQQMRLSRLPEDDVDKLVARIAELKVAPRTAAELGLFLLVSVTAGVWEELLYRGFLIGYISARLDIGAALLLSSAIFGIGHAYQGWRGVLNTGLVGLVFAALYAFSQSLWWLMLAHALVDMNGGLAAWRVAVRVRREATIKVN